MEPEKHPFAAMTAGQRYYFTVKLQSNIGELTEYEDDLFQVRCTIVNQFLSYYEGMYY
jgi:hypothetical protein